MKRRYDYCFLLTFLFALIVFLPPVVQSVCKTSSKCSGLLIATIPLYALVLWYAFDKTRNFIIPSLLLNFFVLLGLLFLHYYLVGYFFLLSQNNIRFFGSVSVLFSLGLSSLIFSKLLSGLSNDDFDLMIKVIFIFLFLNVIASLAKIDFFNEGSKAVFFFSEPSHFALVLAPFFIYYTCLSRPYWILFFLFYLSWSIYIQSLSTLLVLLLSCVVKMNMRERKYMSLLMYLTIFSQIICFMCFYMASDISYFSERINLLSVDNNISKLIYLQGWQNAYLNFITTCGLGVGFQQQGDAGQFGEISNRVLAMTGEIKDFYGGAGALGSKLLSELGIFGFLLISTIIKYAYNSLINIRKDKRNSVLVFYHCTCISILLDIFVRGEGYFCSEVFIFITFYFLTKTIIPKRNIQELITNKVCLEN